MAQTAEQQAATDASTSGTSGAEVVAALPLSQDVRVAAGRVFGAGLRAIQRLRARLSPRAEVEVSVLTPTPPVDLAVQARGLEELRRIGLLSEAEFELTLTAIGANAAILSEPAGPEHRSAHEPPGRRGAPPASVFRPRAEKDLLPRRGTGRLGA